MYQHIISQGYKYVLGLFLMALTLSSNGQATAQDSLKNITLEDLWVNYSFYPKGVYGLRSMNDGNHYTVLSQNKYIIKYEFETGKAVDTLFNVDTQQVDSLKYIQGYNFNDNEDKIVVYTDRENIYRRSFTANYYVYDILKKEITAVSENGKQQLASLSPDGTKVSFVRKNNIYIKDLIENKEYPITTDGEYNKIINGVPDWVYEEEFEFNKAFFWSPEGNYIAYIKFDESLVKEFHMTMFAGEKPRLENNDPYPEARVWKYPKAGEDNSITSVHIYNMDSKQTTTVDVGTETDQYIPRIRWTKDPNQLSVFRLNRLQNKFDILLADAQTGNTKVMYSEENKCYIDEANFDDITFLDDKKHFILVSEMDGWNHIYLMNMNGEVVEKVTEGNYDVTSYIGFDKKKKYVYFQAAKENPTQREIYRYSLRRNKLKKISTEPGTNRATFSKSYKYYILTHSSANQLPTTKLYRSKRNKLIRTLEDNAELKEKLTQYAYTTKKFFSFKTSEDTTLFGYMIKPLDFDENKKYPVFMTQYSGPNSQQAADNWSMNWNNYLAQEGYIVVCVDGRGTAARGEAFRKVTYLQLGKYEITDQIETAKYLSTLPYVDKDNIAIWGWSFGGFMSSLALTKGNGIFKAGIAVAPVTNWKYYDNIYTERFMRTPQENKDGYEQNSPLNFAKDLQGHLLIIHGTADDNVHVQNTMEFTEKLVQADKDFDMFIYTNRNHSIYGGNTRYHLFKKMTNFLNKHLKNN